MPYKVCYVPDLCVKPRFGSNKHFITTGQDQGFLNIILGYGANLQGTKKQNSFQSVRTEFGSGGASSFDVIDPGFRELVCYGYGAARRLGGTGLGEDTSHVDACASLFDEEAALTNAEEWLLRTDYTALKLTYTWENLLFACQRCNQERKKNLFPLADETKRARDHRQSIAGEKPLLIDPVNEDPQQLIGFDPVGVPYPIRNNRRAKATITVLGLDRPKLNERRHGHLQMLESLHALATILRGSKAMPSTDPDLIKIEILLRQAVEDEAEYTALARATLP